MLEPKDCLICFETITKLDTDYWSIEGCDCRIVYHDTCIQSWNESYPQSCPLCRKQVKIYNRYDNADAIRFVVIFFVCCIIIISVALAYTYR